MRKKATRKRPYFTMESAMTAILRDASGKMLHGILFACRLVLRHDFNFVLTGYRFYHFFVFKVDQGIDFINFCLKQGIFS